MVEDALEIISATTPIDGIGSNLESPDIKRKSFKFVYSEFPPRELDSTSNSKALNASIRVTSPKDGVDNEFQ